MALFLSALEELQRITKKYENQLAIATLANSKLREITDKLSESLQSFKTLFESGNDCTICHEHKVSHTVLPCRHCFCNRCSSACLRTRCHRCRAQCSSIERVYL